MDLAIRSAIPADARLLSEMRLTSHLERAARFGRVWMDFIDECVRVFEPALAEGSLRAWLAFDGELAVGTATLALLPTLPRYERQTGPSGRWLDGRIRNVYVDPAYRRRGIGLALMRCALDEAARECVDRLSLGTSDEGRPLYEHLGFRLKDDEMVLREE